MDIEVYARPLGFMQITCPRCGKEHKPRPIPWRRGDWECNGSSCQDRFRVGIGFSEVPAATGYLMGVYDGYVANRVNPDGTAYDALTVAGTVEWKCPTCSKAQAGYLRQSKLECLGCAKPYFISLLLYKGKKGTRIQCPVDWLIPEMLNTHVKETPNECAPSETLSEGTREAGR